MSEFKVKGVIEWIYPTQTIGESGFRKREFVVQYADNPQYPEFIKFECIQDNCDSLDGFKVGQEVEVTYNLKGRKWINPKKETVYFNTLQCWRLVTSVEPHDIDDQRTDALDMQQEKEENDLPF